MPARLKGKLIAAATYVLEQESHGYRYSVNPVCRHDVHLVDAKSQSYVQHHVECEVRHDKPHEARAASCPHSQHEEEGYDSLNGIVVPVVVAYNHWSRLEHIAQHIVLMELYRLAQQVLDNRLRARRRDVGPAYELAVGNGFAVLAATHRLRLCLGYGVALHRIAAQRIHLLQRERRYANGILAVSLGSFSLLLSLLGCLGLGACRLGCHITWPYDMVVAHACRSPCECGRQKDGEEEELGAEYTESVDEKVGQVYLQSVVERRSGGEEEVECRLPDGELAAAYHQLSADVESQQQQHHGYDEVVGHHRREHHEGETEEQERKQR